MHENIDFFHQWDFVMTEEQRAEVNGMERSLYERVGRGAASIMDGVSTDGPQSVVAGSALVALLKANAEQNKRKGKHKKIASTLDTKRPRSSAAASSRLPLIDTHGDPDEAFFDEEDDEEDLPCIMATE